MTRLGPAVGSPWRLALSPSPRFTQPRPVSPTSRRPSKIRHLREPPALPCFAVASREGSFIRPRLVSLGLSLNRTLVGDAGGGLVASAELVGVCGGSLVDAGALCSGGARVPRRVAGPRPVLSECSRASETPPDAEKPVHTREPMVSPARVGQPAPRFLVSASTFHSTLTTECSPVLLDLARLPLFTSLVRVRDDGCAGEEVPPLELTRNRQL